jgi:hypothetical protein
MIALWKNAKTEEIGLCERISRGGTHWLMTLMLNEGKTIVVSLDDYEDVISYDKKWVCISKINGVTTKRYGKVCPLCKREVDDEL